MEVLFQRAKSFASEAARRSQDLAKEAAKFSQEIAFETAKRSKEIASEASKKADQWKALAGEISPSIAAVTSRSSPILSASSDLSEQELAEYGVTPELREFVNGLTISTFQDFPSDDPESSGGVKDPSDVENYNIRQDLTEWQERHALLVLKAVPEISQFRYSLCPRHMKESRFWKIYFTLVRSHVAPYEEQATLREDKLVEEQKERDSSTTAAVDEHREEPGTSSQTAEKAQKNRSTDDQDLDAYLLGALGSDVDIEDDGYDADFDQLVNSAALDSDTEEEKNNSIMSSLSASAAKVVTASDGSSDGELVEFPSDLDTQTCISKADGEGS